MKTIKTAICGCQGKVDRFAKLLNSYAESEVVAVYDADLALAEKAAAALNCAATDHYDALLSDPALDGVLILTANTTHAEMAIAAAEAGKSIFMEKPLCARLEDAYRIRDAVKAAGVRFYLTDPFVDAPTIHVKRLLREGAIGDLIQLRIRYCDDMGPLSPRSGQAVADEVRKQGGGVLLGTGGHPLHVLHYLLGKPESVYAALYYGSEDARQYGREDFAHLTMTYPGGSVAVAECGIAGAGYTNGIELCGTAGTIRDEASLKCGGALRYRLLALPADAKPWDIRAAAENSPWVTVPETAFPAEPDDHVRYWVRMMAEDIPNDAVGTDPASLHGLSIDGAVDLMELIDAAYRSAKSGAAVRLS